MLSLPRYINASHLSPRHSPPLHTVMTMSFKIQIIMTLSLLPLWIGFIPEPISGLWQCRPTDVFLTTQNPSGTWFSNFFHCRDWLIDCLVLYVDKCQSPVTVCVVCVSVRWHADEAVCQSTVTVCVVCVHQMTCWWSRVSITCHCVWSVSVRWHADQAVCQSPVTVCGLCPSDDILIKPCVNHLSLCVVCVRQMTCWSSCGTGRRSGSVRRCLRVTPTTWCRLSSIQRTTTRSPAAHSTELSRFCSSVVLVKWN